jgi:hypothetical protein
MLYLAVPINTTDLVCFDSLIRRWVLCDMWEVKLERIGVITERDLLTFSPGVLEKLREIVW